MDFHSLLSFFDRCRLLSYDASAETDPRSRTNKTKDKRKRSKKVVDQQIKVTSENPAVSYNK